jgi:hypothetical protein
VNKQSTTYSVILVCLRAALVLALAGAVWSVYRRLPDDGPVESMNGRGATTLLIVLRRSPDDAGASLDIPVELYPIDVAAVQREFIHEPHPGVRFNDFLARRMNGRSTVGARLDNNGQTTVVVTPGKWWVHATLAGTLNVEWRLPVNVSGRKQTVELTPENAYARTKSF